MDSPQVFERDLTGEYFHQVTLLHRISLDYRAEHFSLYIECPFTITSSSGICRIDPDDIAGYLQSIHELLGKPMLLVRARDGDGLELRFEDDTLLSIRPHPDYEAFNFYYHDILVVAMPGGDLAIFDPEHQ